MSGPELVVAISGASGAAYGLRLVRALAAAGRRVQVVVSAGGARGAPDHPDRVVAQDLTEPWTG